jgi:hypothetical protein
MVAGGHLLHQLLTERQRNCTADAKSQQQEGQSSCISRTLPAMLHQLLTERQRNCTGTEPEDSHSSRSGNQAHASCNKASNAVLAVS